jgi:hypothetical protein
MKRSFRKILKVLGIIVIVLAVAGYFLFSKIDETPYMDTTYYKNTIEGLNKALKDRNTADGKLMAGFAAVNITPDIEPGKPDDPSKGIFNSIKMAGFGDGQIARGVYDSVYTKAVALKAGDELAVLVSAYILFMPPDVVELVKKNVQKDLGIQPGQLFMGATHTHSSWGNFVPALIGKVFSGNYNPEVVKWLSVKMTKVIEEAVADMKPAEIGTGYAHAPNLVMNRMIGKTGRLNDKFTVISIRQDSGRSAAIGVFAAHPTVVSSWSDKLGGDYPGEFQKSLEAKGVDVAMFFAGTVGSHTNVGKGSKFEKIKYIGETLADSAVAVMNRIDYADSANFSMVTAGMEVPRIQPFYITQDLRLSSLAAGWIFPELGHMYVQALKVNDFVWFTVPCELSGEYAIDLKNALEVYGYNSVFTSFNGQYLGYVVPTKYYFHNHYESRIMSWFGPSFGDYIMELEYTMARDLTGIRL